METCSLSWQGLCFCLLQWCFSLASIWKKTPKSGHQNSSGWEKQSTCNALDHDFQSHHCAKNPVTVKHWILMRCLCTSLLSQKISPLYHCLSLVLHLLLEQPKLTVLMMWHENVKDLEGFVHFAHRNFFPSRKTLINTNHRRTIKSS